MTRKRNDVALDTYRFTSESLRRCLMLGDIAAEHGNDRRAAEHLLEALRELAPELRELRKTVRLRTP